MRRSGAGGSGERRRKRKVEAEQEKTMGELLQKLSALSGREYGLLETLIRVQLLDGEQLVRWMQGVVDDRLALAEAYLGHARACELQKDTECRQTISR